MMGRKKQAPKKELTLQEELKAGISTISEDLNTLTVTIFTARETNSEAIKPLTNI